MRNIKDKRSCPRCNQVLGDYPALSRRDNKTNICSACGIDEALFDFKISNIGIPKKLVMIKEEKRWMERLEE